MSCQHVATYTHHTGKLPAHRATSSPEKLAATLRRGDVLLTRPGPAQHHLLIALGADGFVHAHAGLRRVVCQQLVTLDPLLAQWRIDSDQEQTWQL